MGALRFTLTRGSLLRTCSTGRRRQDIGAHFFLPPPSPLTLLARRAVRDVAYPPGSPGRRSVLQSESRSLIMVLNIPGLAVMVFFYLLVLGIGIWASFKSKREAKKCDGDKTDMALLGNRGISLVVGIFTMTGE